MHPLDNEALKLGAKAVRRRRLDAENRQDFISLLGRVVVILLCAWVLFTQVFLLTQAKGSSMFPAVKDGDLLICYRLQKTYAKNDVVVYTQGGKPMLASSGWAASLGARATLWLWTTAAPLW